MAICARLGPRRAGLLVVALVLARAELLARAAVLALAAVAVATIALSAVQAAMRPAATTRLPRIMFVTRARIDPELWLKLDIY
jgi:hypothetical protein